eukprot:TRINITY_DN16961_c0_g2_i1.p1 TRINITY_DN16961_c0_g2~~TRINITY_DN16961_c0_g2_i1.p1  ORF type:complete len:262 (+),score=42.63 TRINITY_DN16961_c0_g2_i1:40-786(+)
MAPGALQRIVRRNREKEKVREELERTRISQAITELSTGCYPHQPKLWELAALWNIDEEEPLPNTVGYLELFQCNAVSDVRWGPNCNSPGSRPQLELHLEEHVEQAGHTWYVVQCALITSVRTSWARSSSSSAPPPVDKIVEWEAPRRLAQLRAGLHDPLRDFLGETMYRNRFGDAPFAKHGGWSGTTARLKNWLSALASLVNSDEATPGSVLLALNFFRAHSMLGRQSLLEQRRQSQDRQSSESNCTA